MCFRTHTSLLFTRQPVEKDKLDERGSYGVTQKATVGQPPTHAVSTNRGGKRRFMHVAMVPQRPMTPVRWFEMVDRVRHGKVCRTRA